MIRINSSNYYPIQHLIELGENGVCSLTDGSSLLMPNLEELVSLIGQYNSKIQKLCYNEGAVLSQYINDTFHVVTLQLFCCTRGA